MSAKISKSKSRSVAVEQPANVALVNAESKIEEVFSANLESKDETAETTVISKENAVVSFVKFKSTMEASRRIGFDRNIVGVFNQFHQDPYLEQLYNLEIPTEGPDREKLLAREKILRFSYIFQEELNIPLDPKNLDETLWNVFFNENDQLVDQPNFAEILSEKLSAHVRNHLFAKERQKIEVRIEVKDALFNIFLKAVMHDYVGLANQLLIHFPDFLTKRGTVRNKLNNTPQLEDKNALEIACHQGSLDMATMLSEHYADKAEAFNIINKYYPDIECKREKRGLNNADIKTVQKLLADEDEPLVDTLKNYADQVIVVRLKQHLKDADGLFRFNNSIVDIVKIIDEHREILAKYDVSVYIQKQLHLIDENKIDSCTEGKLKALEKATPKDIESFEKIGQAIDHFRALFTLYEDAQDKNLGIQNLSKAWNIYLNSRWNDNQNILFFSNIIGFLHTRLSVTDAFANSQGLKNINEGQKLTRQSLTIRDYTKKTSVDISFYSRCLGLSFGLYSNYTGMTCGRGIRWCDIVLKNFVEQKPAGFMNLKNVLQIACEQRLSY